MSSDIGFSIEELEELYVVFKVRSKYGILLYVVPVRLALLLSDIFLVKVVRPHSQCLNYTHSEGGFRVNGKK